MAKFVLLFIFLYVTIFGYFLWISIRVMYKGNKDNLQIWKATLVFGKILYGTVSILFAVNTVFLIIMGIHGKTLPMGFEGGAFYPYSVWISWNYSMLFFLPFILIFLVIAGSLWFLREIFSHPVAAFPLRKTLVYGYLAFFLVLFTLIHISNRSPEVRKISLDLPHVGRVEKQKLRILQISDTHIGNIIHRREMAKIAALVNATEADILVLTGDIIDNNNEFIPIFSEFYHSLKKIPTYAIIGNHDHIDSVRPLVEEFRKLGIVLLDNDSRQFKDKNGNVWQIVGTDYPFPHFQNAQKRKALIQRYYSSAFGKTDNKNPVLFLLHDPKDLPIFFSRMSKDNKRMDLSLAGHTHGSQICFPFFLKFLENNIHPFIRGHYVLGGGTPAESHLYVNAGTGHWMPVRLCCPPEITLLEIF